MEELMSLKHVPPAKWRATALASALTLLSSTTPMSAQANLSAAKRSTTNTPIQHVIVIIGENRTFDHIFATYQPKQGQTVNNLLSEGIVQADGTPGPNFAIAHQNSAVDTFAQLYQMSPGGKSLYSVLPTPLVGGPTTPFFQTLEQAMQAENGLAPDYYQYMLTGGTGLTHGQPDTRITNVTNLPPGPFQLTNATTHPYDVYDNSPVHRFYQMWQQSDCNTSYITTANPSGCDADLFPWVEVSVGAGANGLPVPGNLSEQTTGEGATSMAIYNVQQGDAPYLKYLADNYAMSDNYHQAVMGGTGANHIMMGTGDAMWFSDGSGTPQQPPHHQLVGIGSANQGVVDEIENPNPAPGPSTSQPTTENWYIQDGYGGGSYGSPSYGGGSYSNCSDLTAPGVASVVNYLGALNYHPDPRCEQGHWYLLNNYNPGYFGDGSDAYTDNNDNNTVFTIPPSTVRNIGDELLANNISWKYYGDQWNRYLSDKYYLNPLNVYCNICNFFQYSTSIMTNPAVRTAHLKDTTDLYDDIASGDLPAVSYVKPSGIVDGHPASSKLDLFEGFVKKIVDGVQANPSLWQTTAIFVTFDEGGGYYDSGYIQPLDFFGDGSRIPMIVVSPYTTAGRISHQYTDHVSILKFVEYNWGLPPLTDRSRDNLPNPIPSLTNPYAPSNSPAIGDLTDLFSFGGR
jgi:phospholipase C